MDGILNFNHHTHQYKSTFLFRPCATLSDNLNGVNLISEVADSR